MTIKEILAKLTAEAREKLENAQTEEEFLYILEAEGLSNEEIGTVLASLLVKSESDEMDEAELDQVAGGLLQAFLARMEFRITTGNLFCKSTVDKDTKTITVCSRFGSTCKSYNY